MVVLGVGGREADFSNCKSHPFWYALDSLTQGLHKEYKECPSWANTSETNHISKSSNLLSHFKTWKETVLKTRSCGQVEDMSIERMTFLPPIIHLFASLQGMPPRAFYSLKISIKFKLKRLCFGLTYYVLKHLLADFVLGGAHSLLEIYMQNQQSSDSKRFTNLQLLQSCNWQNSHSSMELMQITQLNVAHATQRTQRKWRNTTQLTQLVGTYPHPHAPMFAMSISSLFLHLSEIQNDESKSELSRAIY